MKHITVSLVKSGLVTSCLATFVCALALHSATAFAQDDDKTPEIIFTGDSWTTLPCLFDSIGNAFFNRGVTVKIGDCLNTSHIGANADNFKTKYASAYNETLRRVRDGKNVKAVYISLGGNDMFKYWTKTMGAKAEADLFVYIRSYVEEFVSDIHKIKPNVWVLISGYDNGYMYANNPISSYRKIYEHMGEPTPAEVFGGFSRMVDAMAQIHLDHTVYQHHMGLMHYYYGAPEAGVPAKKTEAPALISPSNDPTHIGGVHGVRNSKYAQAHIFNYFYDPHHLRPQGFMRLFEHAVDGYMGKWVKGKAYQAPKEMGNEQKSGEVSAEVESQAEQMVEEEFSKIYDN